MEIKDILEKCDHTLLRVDCTSEEIRKLCDQAIQYHCASVCIPPAHIPGAKRYVGDKLRLCTVIGFPNGYNTSAVKAFEELFSKVLFMSPLPERHFNLILIIIAKICLTS